MLSLDANLSAKEAEAAPSLKAQQIIHKVVRNLGVDRDGRQEARIKPPS